MLHRRSTLFGLMMVMSLAFALITPAQPGAAQSATPRDGLPILNSAGGGGIDDPPRFTINGDGTFAAQFDGNLVTGGTEANPATGFMFYTGGTLYGTPTLTQRSEAPSKANWASSTVTETIPDVSAQQVLSTGTYTLTISYQTLAQGIVISVAVAPTPPDMSTRLYFVSNTNAGGQTSNVFEDYYVEAEEDNILSYDDEAAGVRYLAGFTKQPNGFYADSLIAGSEACVFGKLSGCPSSGPAGGAQYNGDELTAADLVLGAEWMPYFSSPGLIWFAGVAPIPEEPAEEESVVTPAQQCLNTTDMAISPERIEIAPGGSTTVNLTVRNTDTVPQGYHDVVLSLSDGLSVSGVSEGMRNLGQRAALEQLVLQPNETRSIAVTVTAADSLPTAPIHVAELYCGGRVVSRIDGVFVLVAAPATENAAPTAAPAVVAPAPAPTAEPAPLPVVLPNTAGEQRSGDWSAAGLALLITLGAWVLLRRRRA